jgi:mannose-6-phosphate isomerase-like protein (cupin superfamily)
MAGYVGRLNEGETMGRPDFFKGPWRSFARLTLGAGTSREFVGDKIEQSIFVLSGEGTAHVGSATQPLDVGAALTVGYQASVTIAAGEAPIELFITTLDVPADAL